MNLTIHLYGSKDCHKTQYYISELENYNLNFSFFDVKKNEQYAEQLRSLYESRRLNFPTIMLGNKKLRNPSDTELKKWLFKKELIKQNI